MMTATDARFDFPGFKLEGTDDTLNHEIEFGTIETGGKRLAVKVMRRKGLDGGGKFLVSQVLTENGKLIWQFDKKSTEALGFLAMAGDEAVVAFVSNGMVDSVTTIPPTTQAVVSQRIERKKLAAEFLGLDYRLNEAEEKVLRYHEQKRRALLAEQDAKREEERKRAYDERRRARQERLNAITARPMLQCFTLGGEKRWGTPVVGDEWHILQNATFVVVVESYNDATKQAGTVIEAFQVIKKGGPPEKRNASPVTAKQPGAIKKETPKPVKSVLIIDKKGNDFEVQLYPTLDIVDKAYKDGLNLEPFFSAPNQFMSNGTKLKVYKMTESGRKELGVFDVI